MMSRKTIEMPSAAGDTCNCVQWSGRRVAGSSTVTGSRWLMTCRKQASRGVPTDCGNASQQLRPIRLALALAQVRLGGLVDVREAPGEVEGHEAVGDAVEDGLHAMLGALGPQSSRTRDVGEPHDEATDEKEDRERGGAQRFARRPQDGAGYGRQGLCEEAGAQAAGQRRDHDGRVEGAEGRCPWVRAGGDQADPGHGGDADSQRGETISAERRIGAPGGYGSRHGETPSVVVMDGFTPAAGVAGPAPSSPRVPVRRRCCRARPVSRRARGTSTAGSAPVRATAAGRLPGRGVARCLA